MSFFPREPWMDRSACRGRDPDMWFPETRSMTRQTRTAISICHECPVILECDAFSREVHAIAGIWAGRWIKEKHAPKTMEPLP